VELSTDNKTFTELTRLEPNTTSYVVTGLTKNTDYYFRVKAYGADGLESPYVTVATETLPDASAPSACVNPSPAEGEEVGTAIQGLTLTWENSTADYYGTVTYTVYFGTHPDSLKRLGATTAKSFEYTNQLEANKTYYWRVNARNDKGTTKGTVWSFKAFEGGTLFYCDFNTTPADYASAYPASSGNVNIINGNTTKKVAGMVFGANGSSSARIVALSASNVTGGYTADDEGATARCIEFTSGSGYIQLPEVSGPATITIWTGNSDTSSKTFNLKTTIGGTTTTAASFTLANAKKNFKHTYTYTGTENVIFTIDGNGNKFRVHDVLIERYVPADVNADVEVSSLPQAENVSYMDGSMTFNFKNEINYEGGATINGDQFERLTNVQASGKSLTVNYEALDANTDYVITFPEGSITNFAGSKTIEGGLEFEFKTADFGALDAINATHKGRAAALPINFKPFDTIGLLARENGTTQEATNEHPHWVQVSGDKSADKAVMTSTSDKIMTFFQTASSAMRLKADYEGTAAVELKIQETRNADVTPGWRTIRVLRNADFPFDGVINLNSEARFIKIVPTKLTGSITISEFRVADASGEGLYDGGENPTSIRELSADVVRTEYFTLAGERVSTPRRGLYIMRTTTAAGQTATRKVIF
jgi:hypothetical protein